nr:VanZ family protein [Lunatimonas salinarum]
MPTFPGFDKSVHFTLFFGLVFLWARFWNAHAKEENKTKKLFINYLVFGIIFAIFTEYLQTYVPNRSFDYLDIGANLTGGATGMVLFVYLNKKRSILV